LDGAAEACDISAHTGRKRLKDGGGRDHATRKTSQQNDVPAHGPGAILKPSIRHVVMSRVRPAGRAGERPRLSRLDAKTLTYPRPESANAAGPAQARGALAPASGIACDAAPGVAAGAAMGRLSC